MMMRALESVRNGLSISCSCPKVHFGGCLRPEDSRLTATSGELLKKYQKIHDIASSLSVAVATADIPKGSLV
jgi:hypothetical protein